MSKQQIPIPAAAELAERRKLCERVVTLNGERAAISGARNRFATVRQFDSGLSAEWAWPTVKRIVAEGGAFTTEPRASKASSTHPSAAMRPGKDALRPSCLVMNPQNARASETRRAKLLAAFDSLDCNDRADLLEEIETQAFSGQWEAWKHDARRAFEQMYVAAGWGTIGEDGKYRENRPGERSS